MVSICRTEYLISLELNIIRAKLSGDTPAVGNAVSRSSCHLSHWKSVCSTVSIYPLPAAVNRILANHFSVLPVLTTIHHFFVSTFVKPNLIYPNLTLCSFFLIQAKLFRSTGLNVAVVSDSSFDLPANNPACASVIPSRNRLVNMLF